MKKVLIPTDFSENAYNAASYALQLFKDEACTFYLIHTYIPTSFNSGMMINGPSAVQLEAITRKNAIIALDKMEEDLVASFGNSKHKIVKKATFNLLITEITDCVKENGIDLIVMGTKGATGAKEVFLGSNTMYTIKKSKCPVIAVPSSFAYEMPKEILFTTDYKFDVHNKFLALIKDICKTHVSRLNVLNAYYGVPLDGKQKHNKEFLDSFFMEEAHLFHVATGLHVIDAITEFQTKNKINLLVMVHNHHSFFENLLFKPVINEVVHHTNLPFLVIPCEERTK
jgi:nucleotide-binding universal stress UspA family protein